VAGVELVVLVVDLVASGPGVELVEVVVDLVASEPGVVLVVLVDLVTSSAEPRASSSTIVAISIATNIFFISKPLFACDLYACDLYESRLLPLWIIPNVFRAYNVSNPKLQTVIQQSVMSLQI
jgi:hypothetical protein